ncbi:retrovirus-related pol polyprotein from transposon TNT 1-94 [Tanacetum coccineum]|uniref:Retrovirus-related pol polyprotein from transposon TNT 1-94 n=1 Tax=Tanacetum coccineum TaxID=301880 RepID=A0ABQ4YNE9_9ASTR
MQDELNQFKRLDVWELVERPTDRNVIKVKWIWKNKTDAENTIVRNKSRLISKDLDFPNHVYRLKKAMYGLKQALRAWYDKLSSFLIDHHFTKVFSNKFAKLMKDNFEMSMMGEMKFFLGIQARSTKKHLKEVKRIFRCLKQTYNMGLWYSKDSRFELIAYSDADLAGRHDDYKSTSGGIQFREDNTDQLVTTKYQGIGRCNNYAVLSNIMCPKECKIVGQLLVDHDLSYNLTVDRLEITYTVDMFCVTLKLSVETPNYPFIAPATLKFIQPFLKIVGYQTKINILPIFHALINRVHVDNASLLWRDFLHCVQQNKDVIQYPRFTNLIIVDLMQQFDSIPKRLEEDCHSIKDDVSLESKDYAKEFVRVDVLMIQPQPVESTQGTNMTPRATRTPNLAEDVQHVSTTIPPPSDDQERDEIVEATLLSLSLHKTTKIAEEQENVAAVEKKHLDEDVEKIVEGEDEESYASKFADFVFLDEEDSGTRLEPESHKENPEIVDDDDDDEEEKKDDKKDDDNDDDDNDDHDDHALVRNKVTGSSEVRNEKMQTPIPSPLRSPRTDLSLDKTISQELTTTLSPTLATTTQDQSKAKCISSKYKNILGALNRICRRQGFMIKQMEKKFVTNHEFQGIKENIDRVLHEIIPHIASNATNDIIKDNLPRVIVDAVIKERDTLQAIVHALIYKEFVDHAPKIIEELFKTHMKKNVITIHPTTSTSTATSKLLISNANCI